MVRKERDKMNGKKHREDKRDELDPRRCKNSEFLQVDEY